MSIDYDLGQSNTDHETNIMINRNQITQLPNDVFIADSSVMATAKKQKKTKPQHFFSSKGKVMKTNQ